VSGRPAPGLFGLRTLVLFRHAVPPAAQVGVVAVLLALAAYFLISTRLIRHLFRLMVCLSAGAIIAALAVGWVDHARRERLLSQQAVSGWPVLRTLLYGWLGLTGGIALVLFVAATVIGRKLDRRGPRGLGRRRGRGLAIGGRRGARRARRPAGRGASPVSPPVFEPPGLGVPIDFSGGGFE
jgi:hypothetical protein